MYAPNGVLLPTVSNDVRSSREEIINYFKYFLLNKPQGKIDEHYVRHVAQGVVALSGIYTFTMGSTGAQVQARFTYIFQQQPSGKVRPRTAGGRDGTVRKDGHEHEHWARAVAGMRLRTALG